MAIEWIEDFLCLANSRSFSHAANSRHPSQPAFSHRIQALESWLGVELIDRSTSPLMLTPSGRAFRGFAEDMVRQLKAMVVAGNGVAWLPEKCAAKEVGEGKVSVAGADAWSTQLEIRMFRSSENRHPFVERLWSFLQK